MSCALVNMLWYLTRDCRNFLNHTRGTFDRYSALKERDTVEECFSSSADGATARAVGESCKVGRDACFGCHIVNIFRECV